MLRSLSVIRNITNANNGFTNLIKQELSENPTLEIINKNEDINLEVESGTSDQDQFDMEISSYRSDNYDYASPSELTENTNI